MKKSIMWIIVVLVLLTISFFVGKQQDSNIIIVNLPDKELFYKACLYHGVEEAWISINGTEFYATRYNEEKGRIERFMLFTNDFTRSIAKEIKKDQRS